MKQDNLHPLFSISSARPRFHDHDAEDIPEDNADDPDNIKRRKRFQSAFKVPTSNRPSHDHTNDKKWQAEYVDDDDGGNDSIIDDEDY